MTQPTVEITIEVGGPTVTIAAAGAQGPPGPAGADGAPGVVQSVNGQSAANVTLTAADVQALPLTGGTVTGALTLGGALQIPTGAQAGYAWTSDANGAGSWQPGGSGGGVQIGGDLGGTNAVPLVQSTHLTDPLPLAQGGTGAADAAGARTALGLGSAATADATAFDAAGSAAAAQAAAITAAEGNAASTYVPLAGLTGPLSFGGFKATNLADGTAATDAATFGQIPTALPPDGAASGDLSGTYPAPAVARINGTSVPAGPTAGQILGATSGTEAAWVYSGASNGPVNPSAARFGLVSETISLYQANLKGNLPSGTLALALMWWPAGQALSKLSCYVAIAGTSLSGVNALGLYTPAGVLVTTTGDMTAQFGTPGWQESSLLAPPTPTADTIYYVGVLTHAAGTLPAIEAYNLVAAFGVVNGVYGAITFAGQSAHGSFTPSAGTPVNGAYWFGAR